MLRNLWSFEYTCSNRWSCDQLFLNKSNSFCKKCFSVKKSAKNKRDLYGKNSLNHLTTVFHTSHFTFRNFICVVYWEFKYGMILKQAAIWSKGNESEVVKTNADTVERKAQSNFTTWVFLQKVQLWCSNCGIWEKMMAHWADKEHWSVREGPNFILKEIWDGERFNSTPYDDLLLVAKTC